MVKEHNKLKALGIVAIVILALFNAPTLYVQEGHAAFDAGTDAGKVAIDKEFYDKLVANNSEWTVVKEFLLEPGGSKPPMRTMGRPVKITAGQVLRISQPGERGNVVDLMFLNSDNLDEHNHMPTQFLQEGLLVNRYTRRHSSVGARIRRWHRHVQNYFCERIWSRSKCRGRVWTYGLGREGAWVTRTG